MIEKLFEYRYKDIKYVFMRDCHFTFVQGRVVGDPNGKFMIGAAFCTKEDEYRVDIGCHVALERYCKNLRFDRKQRLDVHRKLDQVLADKVFEQQVEFVGKSVDSILKRLFREEVQHEILFGDTAKSTFQIIIDPEKGKKKCQ